MTPASDTPRAPLPGRADERCVDTLQGLVELVTFHDETSQYTVLKIAPEKGYAAPPDGELFAGERLTAVGRALQVSEGTRVRLTGRWGRHPTHGTQFEFEALEPLAPADERGLVRYLASAAFQGVGPTLAERIVKALGSDALEAIREDRSALDGVRGLATHVADNLHSAVRAQAEMHRLHAFLLGLGLGPVQSQAVVRRLGAECEPLLRADPYLLAQVPRLGFRIADLAARELGVTGEDPRRLRAALTHALSAAASDGHSFLRLGALLARVARELREELGREPLLASLADLEREETVVLGRDLIDTPEQPFEQESAGWDDELPCYLPWLYASEVGLARSLLRLLEREAPPVADLRALETAEDAADIVLDDEQRQAVLAQLSSPVSLLTGGPGVGKTTIVRFVVALAEAAGMRVLLASPTGRAAKRLAEATERPASTVHRLLGFRAGDEGFVHGTDNPLDAGLVIIDEISMLDVVLAHHLLKAVAAPTRLVLVGDPDQLPSVGPGNVLADLLQSGRIPVARLTRIFRQHEHSLIVANAHRILAGELPLLPPRGDRSADFYLFPCEDPEETARLLVEVVTRRIPENFGHRWDEDVQVIAPMYRGPCGVDALNDALREALGIGGREVSGGRMGGRWRVGDRVIHTRNDYEREVFNGDMGRIRSVSEEGVVTVRFPERELPYSGSELSDLRPAFAITVHRSQGGEFPVVVLPLVTQHAVMLQRNLLYTAVTRARQLVVLVGSRRALGMAVANADQAQRESALAERLQRSGSPGLRKDRT